MVCVAILLAAAAAAAFPPSLLLLLVNSGCFWYHWEINYLANLIKHLNCSSGNFPNNINSQTILILMLYTQSNVQCSIVPLTIHKLNISLFRIEIIGFVQFVEIFFSSSRYDFVLYAMQTMNLCSFIRRWEKSQHKTWEWRRMDWPNKHLNEIGIRSEFNSNVSTWVFCCFHLNIQ